MPHLSASSVVIHYEEALSSICTFTYVNSLVADRVGLLPPNYTIGYAVIRIGLRGLATRKKLRNTPVHYRLQLNVSAEEQRNEYKQNRSSALLERLLQAARGHGHFPRL